jgi:hypothetical protein
MPVRIIFRGLILFRIEDEGSRKGKIIADLVDDRAAIAAMRRAARASTKKSSTHAGHRPRAVANVTPTHVHGHFPELQVYTTKKRGIDRLELDPGRDIDISVNEPNSDYVLRHDSYKEHCPKLSHILANATRSAFHDQDWQNGNRSFVRTRVTVHRGTIRVKDVVSWDAGAAPLEQPSSGLRTETPALVSFLGSTATGHMASECVIDIEHATEVTIRDNSKPKPTKHLSKKEANTRVPEKTVEILVTNFPAQQERALPWSLHFLWLFRAGGYNPQPIEDELQQFKSRAREYLTLAIRNDDEAAKEEEIQRVIASELAMVANGTGFPIPYLKPATALTRLEPIVADPWYLPLCPQGDNSNPLGGP